MARSSWLGLLLVLSLVLGLGLAASCAKSDKGDDDSSGDDSSGECTVNDLCDYAVTTCNSTYWTSLQECYTDAATELQSQCGTNANAALGCMCDCLANTTGCSGYESCVAGCYTQYCF